jgi:alkylation response protein AidB-like acyl-CoA dehydrogenase
MDARFSPEQVALRDSAAQVVARLGVESVAQLDDAERASKLDAAIAAAGWRELRADTGNGAPWASAVEAAIIAEELGRGLADAPFIGPTLAADLRRLAAAPAASTIETVVLDETLRRLASANGIAIDSSGSTTALLALDGDRIASAALADDRVFVDLTRPSAAVVPNGDVESLDSSGAVGPDAWARWKALALALTSADLVGVMRGALDVTNEYAKSRRQYGEAIGSFQAVQHLLADALVAMEGSRSVAQHAAWAVDALAPEEALSAGAVAKVYCSRAARAVCETAIQVHGGIGNTWDCLAHVFLRRALLSIDILGGVGANLPLVLRHHGIGAARGLR